jgi:MFS family permease
MLILPTLLLQLRDQFGVSITQIASLGTVCYFLYGIMALPGGFLADKWSYKAVLAMFFIGTPAAACIVGAAQSVLGLAIGLALLGLFASLYHPSGLAMISHGVRERGKALGLHGMGGNLGLAFSPIIAGSLALRFSWRHAYYFLSLPGFIAGAVFLLISRTAIGKSQSDTASSGDTAQNTKHQSKQRLTLWAIILLYAAMTLTGFCYRGMITMLPTYLGRFIIGLDSRSDLDNGVVSEGLRRSFQYSGGTPLSSDAVISIEEEGSKWQITDNKSKYTVRKEGRRLNVYGRRAAKGGLFATMVLLVGMLGQYMGGHFSDRRRRTRLYLLFNALSLPFMILIGLTSGIVGVVIAALFALFHFSNQPVENSLIAHYTPSRLRSSGYGLKFFLTFGVGSFASGLSGYVADHFGFSSVFLLLGGVIALIVLVVAFLNVVAREKRVEASQ